MANRQWGETPHYHVTVDGSPYSEGVHVSAVEAAVDLYWRGQDNLTRYAPASQVCQCGDGCRYSTAAEQAIADADQRRWDMYFPQLLQRVLALDVANPGLEVRARNSAFGIAWCEDGDCAFKEGDEPSFCYDTTSRNLPEGWLVLSSDALLHEVS